MIHTPATAEVKPKVAAAKPSVEIESQLKLLLDEAAASFDASAKSLLPEAIAP